MADRPIESNRPVESNPNILDMNGEDLIYDYDSVDGEEIFWDTEFEGNIATASASNPTHNSYAHQALCGERVRLKWHSGASSSDIIASNRGPEVQMDGITFNSDSNTLKFQQVSCTRNDFTSIRIHS